MASPSVPSADQLAAWRAQVDKELAGAPFEKLVQLTAEGLALQPLYTERMVEPALPGAAPFVRGALAEARPFQICMRVDPAAARRPEALAEDLDGGADALWAELDDAEAIAAARARRIPLVLELGAMPSLANGADAAAMAAQLGARFAAELAAAADGDGGALWCGFDWIGGVARGHAPPLCAEPAFLRSLAAIVGRDDAARARRPIRVSSLAFHDAGADAADELALMLSSAAAYLRALTGEGLAIDAAAGAIWAQVAIGADTFGEICKLRALRVVWHKLLAAAGARDTALAALHAVGSMRTQAQRDPWVNMLRGTTQVFAAALGGARLITPLAFDAALVAGAPVSAAGRRTARNTALVLREESHLGRVLDAGGGSYYLEARTDALAREAWARFSAIERDGGIAALLGSGSLRERLAAAWAPRAAAIARRKQPVLGVSEFANPDERLPAPVPAPHPAPPTPALIAHRDAEAFEALRARVEAAPPSVVLVLLGPPSEHRPRAGYAAALFAAAGLRVRELAAPTGAADGSTAGSGATWPEAPLGDADVACLCGSDERYAAEAVAHAGELRAAGARTLVLAGRPGALEAELRKAGVGHFIFVGCDVLATLSELVAPPAPPASGDPA